MKNEIMNDKIKKYIQVDGEVEELSCFKETGYALYILEGNLFLMDFIKEKSVKLDEFSGMMKMKCLNKNSFIANNENYIFIAELRNNKVVIVDQIDIEYMFSVSLDASDDLKIIALAGYNDILVVTEGEIKNLKIDDDLYSMAVSRNGELIAYGTENGIYILSSQNFKIIDKIETDDVAISLLFSYDNSMLIYGDDGKNIVSYEINSQNKVLYENPYYSKAVNLALLNDNNFVVTFLSGCIGTYRFNEAKGKIIPLDEFSSRYFQHSDIVSNDLLALTVEDLRIGNGDGSVPTGNLIVLHVI